MFIDYNVFFVKLDYISFNNFQNYFIEKEKIKNMYKYVIRGMYKNIFLFATK